jgi:hypothetical protein
MKIARLQDIYAILLIIYDISSYIRAQEIFYSYKIYYFFRRK